MSQSLDLFRLQRVDSQRDQAAARLREIDRILQQDRRLAQAADTATKADVDLQGARKTLKQAEQAVEAQNIKIEETEAALYGGRVRNPKELQDLQNEAASLKRYLRTLEDTQLEAMIAVEMAEQAQRQAADQLARVRAQVEQEHGGLGSETERLRKDLERFEDERRMVLVSIPDERRSLYEQLRQQKRGIAVAGIEDSCCSICGSTLTPAEWQAARSPQKLVFCPSCGRILYAG